MSFSCFISSVMFRLDLHELIKLYWILCEGRSSYYNTETMLQCGEEVKALIQEHFKNKEVKNKVTKLGPIISNEIRLKFRKK